MTITHTRPSVNPYAEKIAKALACPKPGCGCGKLSGRHWITHCPVHPHEHPSLFIAEENGRILVKCHRPGCTQDEVIAALKDLELWPQARKKGGEEPEASDSKAERPSQAEVLIRLAVGNQLFHDPLKTAYASIKIGDAESTFPIRSAAFKGWLRRQFYQATGRAPNAQALTDALGVLEARALYDGPTLPVFTRVAESDGRIYLDLGDDTWKAVEIDPDGWRIISKPPVKFIRRPGMLPLPEPKPGGSIEALRPFLNLPEGEAGDQAWRLLISWLVAALRPTGPYPVLALHGPQGAAKSTTARVLRALIDPNAAPLRAEPREPRDLMITASNAWACAFDNLTRLPDWLSDALCRLSTGGGFSTRMLYSDNDETILDAVRPVILTGINAVAQNQDLVDRQVLIELPAIDNDGRRQEEAVLWERFKDVQPYILGALLDGVSMALRRMPLMHLDRLPRMADFAKWAAAAEAAWGWADGTFMAAYGENRAGQAMASLEADLVASTLLEFMKDREVWEGTPSELLDALTALVPEDKQKIKAGNSYVWPRLPNALTRRLRKAQVFLSQAGIRITEARNAQTRVWRIDRVCKNTVIPVITVIPKENQPLTDDGVQNNIVTDVRNTVIRPSPDDDTAPPDDDTDDALQKYRHRKNQAISTTYDANDGNDGNDGVSPHPSIYGEEARDDRRTLSIHDSEFDPDGDIYI